VANLLRLSLFSQLSKEKRQTGIGLPLCLLFLQSKLLSLGFLAFSTTLTDLESRIALANHIQTTATTHHLAIRVSKFQSANRRNNLHVPP